MSTRWTEKVGDKYDQIKKDQQRIKPSLEYRDLLTAVTAKQHFSRSDTNMMMEWIFSAQRQRRIDSKEEEVLLASLAARSDEYLVELKLFETRERRFQE